MRYLCIEAVADMLGRAHDDPRVREIFLAAGAIDVGGVGEMERVSVDLLYEYVGRNSPPPAIDFADPEAETSFVYFFRAETQIKIGVAVDHRKRLSMLQTGNHCHLTMMGVRGGGAALEMRLHSYFHRDRKRGEWFDASPDLLALIYQCTTRTPNIDVPGRVKVVYDMRRTL